MKIFFTGVIYCAFDETNGQSYVGQSWRWPKRKREHLETGDHYFDLALHKRPEKFSWTILFSGIITQEELDAAETAFIKEMGTLWPHGYNLTEGGRGGRHSELSLQKIRDGQRRANSRPEVIERKRISSLKKWAKPGAREMYRQAMREGNSSPQVRENRSAAQKTVNAKLDVKLRKAGAQPKSRAVVCLNDPELQGSREFPSAKSASRYYGLGSVNEMCYGKRKNSRGLLFKWKDEV